MSAGLYLHQLTLKNFATFENQEISFNPSFNGIVGETGSGKSLVLDAFQLLLGARSDKKLVRKNSECAIIEGVFNVGDSKIKNYFNEEGFPVEDGEVIIKRIIYSNGKSKAFINHLSCPISALNKFSKTFVDLVGQFENQKLGSKDYQLYLVDQFAKNEESLNLYLSIWSEYIEFKKEHESLVLRVKEKEQREDYLKFQLEELKELNPSMEREKVLIESKAKALNKEENSKVLLQVQDLISEGDQNVLLQLKQIEKVSNNSKGLLGEELREKLLTATSLLEDLSYDLSRIDLDGEEDEELDSIIDELDLYQKLKRKFNVETSELIQIKTTFEEELNLLQSLDSELKSCTQKIEELESELYQIATKLHENRIIKARKLEKLITDGLGGLNMKGATFKIQVQKSQVLTSRGLTDVSFTAETNPGEGFYSIKDIASGGELSRILLCLRQIVAAEDSISIFFFDEIDTGIGGDTAQKVAQALKKVSEKSQVLAITHLPQIAKVVDEIIYVDKKSFETDENIRTISFVENKTGKEREVVIQQLAGLS